MSLWDVVKQFEIKKPQGIRLLQGVFFAFLKFEENRRKKRAEEF